MKHMNMKNWMVVILSGFLQRAILPGINPLGTAYFAAAYRNPADRGILPVITLIGMAVCLPSSILLKYMGILVGLMLMIGILERKKAPVTRAKTLAALALLILSANVGYGLALSGISRLYALRHLWTGIFEASGAAVAFLLFGQVMKVFEGPAPKAEETAPFFKPETRERAEEDFVRTRLKDMSASFRKLSRMLRDEIPEEKGLSDEDMRDAFDELTACVCENCGRREMCWEKEYDDTYHSTWRLLSLFPGNGPLEKKQVPSGLRRRCVNMERFLRETNRVMQAAQMNLSWRDRLTENRLAFAGQIGEVAEIIDDLSVELKEREDGSGKLADRLIRKLGRQNIKIKKISVTEESSHSRRQRIYMLARVKRGRCVMTKDLADQISKAAGRRFIPEPGGRSVARRRYTTLSFVEDARYQLIQGTARRTKEGQTVSGDSYAFIYLDSGQVLMSLSDGMGSGQRAKEESEMMIGLLEQMVDTGFGRRSALRMLNSVMLLHGDRQVFSSMDLTVVDLYSGMCEFIKIGASSTFIVRDHKVECVTSGSLPMGAFPEADWEGFTRNLFDGDRIFMVSDGVINRFPDGTGNARIAGLLETMEETNPNGAAGRILAYALEQPGDRADDDMTVLACMICKKPFSVV